MEDILRSVVFFSLVGLELQNHSVLNRSQCIGAAGESCWASVRCGLEPQIPDLCAGETSFKTAFPTGRERLLPFHATAKATANAGEGSIQLRDRLTYLSIKLARQKLQRQACRSPYLLPVWLSELTRVVRGQVLQHSGVEAGF